MDTSSLMEQILSKDNLNAAYLQVVRNKGAAGVDGMTVEELGAYLSENGENIREQLRTRKYKPQPVRRVEIPKPDGGTRNLGVPTVVDRFVQQAVAQVLTPIFEEQFHDHSYGFRPNRCAQQAVLKAFEDKLPVDTDTLMQLGAGYAAGMGCMESTCGALIGAVMAAGILTDGKGTPAVSRQLVAGFQEKCGATICKDLKGIETGRVLCSCPECVRNAVLTLGEVLKLEEKV